MANILNNLIQKIEVKAESFVQSHMIDNIKGLENFIIEIRLCKSREAEINRVNKELANIRNKFRGDKTTDGYSRKKYIAKLIFIRLLGHEVTLGQSESILLVVSTKFTEKQIGYLFLSLTLDTDDTDVLCALLNSIKSDLNSRNHHYIMLAAHCLPSIMCQKTLDDLKDVVTRSLISGSKNETEVQSFLLCYLSMIKFSTQFFKSCTALNDHIINIFPSASDEILNVISHIVYEGLLAEIPEFCSLFSSTIKHIADLIQKTASKSDSTYLYYSFHSPWAIIRLLQILRIIPMKNELAKSLSNMLSFVLKIESKVGENIHQGTKKVHYTNIMYAIIFEAINVISVKPVTDECVNDALNFIESTLNHSEANYRYLALDAIISLKAIPNIIPKLERFSDKLSSMIGNEKNSALRLHVVNVIYAIADLSDIRPIIKNMLEFLKNSEYSIRQELTLKICTIASKKIPDLAWYVDTMITVLNYARHLANEEVWFKVVQMVTNNPEVQEYATNVLFQNLSASNCSEFIIKLGAYLLGEFGNTISSNPSSNAGVQYNLLLRFFPFVEKDTKSIILTALVKMAVRHADLKQTILNFFSNDSLCQNIDNEVQQRVCEYRILLSSNSGILQEILNKMPEYEVENMEVVENSYSYDVQAATTQSFESFGSDLAFEDTNDANVIRKHFIKFSIDKNNLIFENDVVSIYFHATYTGHIGNISLKAVCTRSEVSTKILDHEEVVYEGFKFAPETDQMNLITADSSTYMLKVAAMDVCRLLPVLTLNVQFEQANNSSTKQFTVTLPIFLVDFLQPYNIEPTEFGNIWNSIPTSQELVCDVTSRHNGNFNDAKSALSSCNFSILQNIGSPNDIVAASVYNYFGGSMIGCILHVSFLPNSNNAKMTLRATSDKILSDLSNFIQSVL